MMCEMPDYVETYLFLDYTDAAQYLKMNLVYKEKIWENEWQ